MNESQFIEEIDANFPYLDMERATQLIDLGCSISPNAAFMIPYEIISAPDEIPKERQIELLEEWSGKVDHPIKERIHALCLHAINGDPPASSACTKLYEQMKEYRDIYNALNILRSVCQSSDTEHLYSKTIEAWKSI